MKRKKNKVEDFLRFKTFFVFLQFSPWFCFSSRCFSLHRQRPMKFKAEFHWACLKANWPIWKRVTQKFERLMDFKSNRLCIVWHRILPQKVVWRVFSIVQQLQVWSRFPIVWMPSVVPVYHFEHVFHDIGRSNKEKETFCQFSRRIDLSVLLKNTKWWTCSFWQLMNWFWKIDFVFRRQW